MAPNTSVKRDSNIELFRIVLMILIIMHHFLVNTELFPLAGDHLDSMRSLGAFVMGSFGKTIINCFILITGFYMCKKRITLKKYLILLCEVWFYGVVFLIVNHFVVGTPIDFDNIEHIFLSTEAKSIQFVACFLLFYPLIPFLNILIKNLDFKKHLVLISSLLVIFTVRASTPKFTVPLNYVFWFAVIYLVGAFLNIYQDKLPSFTKKWVPMLGIVLILICTSVLGVYQGMMMTKVSGEDYILFNMMDSNKIIPVILSVSLFLLFKSMRIPYSGVINLFGKTAFGVLIIHTSCYGILWSIIRPAEWYDSPYFYLYMIGYAIALFTVCALIDIIRLFLIERPLVKVTAKYIDKVENRIMAFFGEKK